MIFMVVTNGERSECCQIHSGVPQGGIWSPFLFDLFVRKLPQQVQHAAMLCYADDTTLLMRIPTEKSKCRQTPKVVSVKRAHPAARTPAAGTDNHKINGGTEKELQRSNPSIWNRLESECLKTPAPDWLACWKRLQKEHVDID